MIPRIDKARYQSRFSDSLAIVVCLRRIIGWYIMFSLHLKPLWSYYNVSNAIYIVDLLWRAVEFGRCEALSNKNDIINWFPSFIIVLFVEYVETFDCLEVQKFIKFFELIFYVWSHDFAICGIFMCDMSDPSATPLPKFSDSICTSPVYFVPKYVG